MSDPVLLYVGSQPHAETIQSMHDPAVVLVRVCGRYIADRASSIIVYLPEAIRYGTADQAQSEAFDAWLEWLPTRLQPGDRYRITVL